MLRIHTASACVAWCRIRRSQDIVNVVMVSTTDGVLEEKAVHQYRSFMDKYNVPGAVTVKCIDRIKMTVP